MNIDWTTDANGQVLGPGFHDGSLDGVLLDNQGNLIVYVRNYKKDYFRIILTNVGYSNVKNFWNGSIIGDVWLFDMSRAPKNLLDDMFFGRLLPEDYTEQLDKTMNSHFFALEAVYGGSVYATCDNLVVCIGEDSL